MSKRSNTAAFLILLSIFGGPLLGQDKDKGKEPAEPKLTDEERAQIRTLIGALGKGPPERKVRAAQELGAFGPKADMAVPALERALSDRLANVRSTSVDALGSIASKKAVKALAKALAGHADIGLRRAAALALGTIGAPAEEAVKELVAALDHKDPELRRFSARALGTIGATKGTLEKLAARLDDADEGVRSDAAIALALLGDKSPRLVPLLRAVAADSKHLADLRRGAIQALAKLGPDAADATPTLAQVLSEELPNQNIPGMPYADARKKQHDDLRRAAAIALGAIGPKAKEAIPALEATLQELALREAAEQALTKIRAP